MGIFYIFSIQQMIIRLFLSCDERFTPETFLIRQPRHPDKKEEVNKSVSLVAQPTVKIEQLKQLSSRLLIIHKFSSKATLTVRRCLQRYIYRFSNTKLKKNQYTRPQNNNKKNSIHPCI